MPLLAPCIISQQLGVADDLSNPCFGTPATTLLSFIDATESLEKVPYYKGNSKARWCKATCVGGFPSAFSLTCIYAVGKGLAASLSIPTGSFGVNVTLSEVSALFTFQESTVSGAAPEPHFRRNNLYKSRETCTLRSSNLRRSLRLLKCKEEYWRLASTVEQCRRSRRDKKEADRHERH